MRAARLLTSALMLCASMVSSVWAVPSFVVSAPLSVPKRPFDLAVGDLNNDGIDDLAIIGRGSNKVSIVLIQPDGSFRQGASIIIGSRMRAIAIGDFNNDGNGDMVVSTGTRNIFVIPGNGDGTFGRSATVRRCCTGGGIAVGDFNNSNPGAKFPDDIAVADPSKGDVNILYNKNQPGGASFVVPGVRARAGKKPNIVITHDFNDDDKTDVAALNIGGTGNDVSSILNQGGASFATVGNFFAGKRSRALALGDYNNDGQPDFAAGDQSPNSVIFVPGLGGGLFGTGPTLPIPCALDDSQQQAICRVRAVQLLDFDGDGNADVATLINGRVSDATSAGTGGGDINAILAYTGDGAGGFFGPTRIPNVGLNSRVLKTGKFNSDDKPDFVVASWGDNSIRLIINTSASSTGGTNTPTPTGPTRTPTATVAGGGSPTRTPTVCRGQGCDCDPANGDDDCNVPFFCSEDDEVCCDTPCVDGNVSCSVPGSIGTCVPIDLPNGEDCSANDQCQSGFCVDGVCCNEVCDGATQACNITRGTCTDTGTVRPTTVVPTVTPTPPGGGNTPTATIRLKELGEDCGAGSECRSTFCPVEDLVCCNKACNGTDERCDLPGVKGQCLPINLPSGEACVVDAQCVSGACENSLCSGGPTRTPTPNGTATPTRKKNSGEQCTSGAECSSGFCPTDDSVCCNEACDGENERCDLDPLIGTCLATDLPDNSTCQLDQQCRSRVCQGNVCKGDATPVFTATRTPNNSRVPTPTRTATPDRQPTLILSRGSGCSAGDANGGSGGLALLLALPAWWLLNSRATAPARRQRRRRA